MRAAGEARGGTVDVQNRTIGGLHPQVDCRRVADDGFGKGLALEERVALGLERLGVGAGGARREGHVNALKSPSRAVSGSSRSAACSCGGSFTLFSQ